MTKRGSVAAFGVLALVVALAGCTVAQPRVVDGSIVRVAVDAPLTSLNAASSAGSDRTNLAVASLTRGQFFTYDDEFGAVADPSFGSVTALPGPGFDVEYSLADTATWSDGVRVSAADLLLAWVASSGALDSLLEPQLGFDAPLTVPLATPALFPAVGEDGYSLTVYFGAEFEGWETVIDPQVPAHVAARIAWGIEDAADADAAVVDAILGKDAAAIESLAAVWNTAFGSESLPSDEDLVLSSGPYTVAAWTESTVSLVSNADYRGSRQPRVHTIELLTIPDPLDAVAAFDAGTVDVITPTPSAEVQDALLSIDGATVLTGNDTALEHLDLQVVGGRSGVFADELVRRAFLLTLPRQQIVTEVLGHLFEDATPQSSFLVSQTSTEYAQVVSENGSAVYSEPDTDAAAALLAEAQVNSPQVCVLFDAGDDMRQREFDLIAASASKAGFVISDCSTDDVAATLGKAGAYDAALFAWNVPEPTTAWVAGVYGSAGSTNLTGYSSERVDDLVASLGAVTELDKRAGILASIDTELWADAYGAPLFQHAALTAFAGRVTGVARSPLPSGVFWNATDWTPVDDG